MQIKAERDKTKLPVNWCKIPVRKRFSFVSIFKKYSPDLNKGFNF